MAINLSLNNKTHPPEKVAALYVDLTSPYWHCLYQVFQVLDPQNWTGWQDQLPCGAYIPPRETKSRQGNISDNLASKKRHERHWAEHCIMTCSQSVRWPGGSLRGRPGVSTQLGRLQGRPYVQKEEQAQRNQPTVPGAERPVRRGRGAVERTTCRALGPWRIQGSFYV